MRLILVVNPVAERLAGFIQHHRHVRWAIGLVQVIGQLPQHRCVAIYRADGFAVLVGQRRQPVVSPKNIRGAVNEVEMLLFRHGGSIAVRFGQVFC